MDPLNDLRDIPSYVTLRAFRFIELARSLCASQLEDPDLIERERGEVKVKTRNPATSLLPPLPSISRRSLKTSLSKPLPREQYSIIFKITVHLPESTFFFFETALIRFLRFKKFLGLSERISCWVFLGMSLIFLLYVDSCWHQSHQATSSILRTSILANGRTLPTQAWVLAGLQAGRGCEGAAGRGGGG